MRHVLVLTATVAPTTGFRLAVTDPGERLGQYVSSFGRWRALADRIGLEVLAVENSGAGEAELRAALGGHRLVVAGEAAATDAEGRGVGEARLVDVAAKVLLADGLADDALVTKATGRLFVPNFARAVHLDRLGVQADVKSDLRTCDSRLFTVPFGCLHAHLVGMERGIDERAGRYFEHVLVQRLLACVGAGTPWVGWRRMPEFRGVSGTTGEQYGSATNRVKRRLHDAVRRHGRPRPITL